MITNQSIIESSRYLSYSYRWNILSNPADESLVSRQMWSIIASNRIFAIKYIKKFKLFSNKETIHDYLTKMFDDVLNNSLLEFDKRDISFTKDEFIEGYLGKSWNKLKKYPTIFDVMTEAVERWHVYFLGVGLIFDKKAWLSITSEKLKWNKRRFGNKTNQPFVRSLEIRRHFPFATKKDVESLFFDDCGIKTFNYQVPDEAKKVYGAEDSFC